MLGLVITTIFSRKSIPSSDSYWNNGVTKGATLEDLKERATLKTLPQRGKTLDGRGNRSLLRKKF